MTDQQTQRYRPLAEWEKTESGDKILIDVGDYRDVRNPGWTVPVGNNGEVVRPIPETNWRDPVGEAGYPYPPGTVVQTIGKLDQSIIETVLLPDDSTMTLHDNQVYVRSHFGSKCKHRVIDYRPDLVNQQNNVGSEGMGIRGEEGQPETDPRDQSNEPCCSCQAELTRLRAEVERLTKSNQNWERLSFASANTADTTRDEIEKLRAEVKEYKTSAEIIRDFADLYKQERDEARAEVDRLTAKLAKYQPSEYQSIDLTESTVFVGAAWSEGKGEIQ